MVGGADLSLVDDKLIEEVKLIAQQAGDAIMEIYSAYVSDSMELDSITKADLSPLTLADIASHRQIVTNLHNVIPNVPIVSEEDEASYVNRNAKGVFWLVDPLDGTKEFLAKSSEFTVNIALVKDENVEWGLVFAPALGVMYWGGRAYGTYREVGDGPVKLVLNSFNSSNRRLRVVASKSHLNDETRNFLESLGDLELVQSGSSLKFCRVAENAADIYPRLGPTCEWDTAAAQGVVEGAGGVVHDMDGKRLLYGKPNFHNPHFIAAAQGLGI